MRFACLPLAMAVCLVSVAAQLPQTAASPKTERTTVELVRATADAVVLITASDALGHQIGQGSGFIVSPDGKILTNSHVIAGAHSLRIRLHNGAYFQVERVIAADEEADLALIAVEGKNLPTIPLGDSDAVVIGQRVLAIGNPLGLQNSVSEGIVSGIREASNQKWIQTTAAASPGISGGPLVNSYGEAIGVVTFKLRGENLNFASGIGRARRLMETPTTTQQPLKLSASIGSGLWTSLVTGSDYKVRVDGEYIYTEWVNLPSALQGTAAFSRSELRRVSGAWRGKTRARMPCTYQRLLEPPQVNWCSVENDIEIQSISSSRVEGRAFAPTKVDCRKCQVKASEWKSFAWIPKD